MYVREWVYAGECIHIMLVGERLGAVIFDWARSCLTGIFDWDVGVPV